MIYVNLKYGAGVQGFGNSIPAGGNAPAGAGYLNRMVGFLGGALDNKAVSGTGIQSITQQGYSFHNYGSRSPLVTWDGPLNDIRRYGNAALPAIKPAIDAFLSSAFAGMARPASYPQVIKTGAWAPLGNSYGGKAFKFSATPMYTQDPNAAASLSFNGDRIAVHSYMTEGASIYQDFDVLIDGNPYDVEFAGLALPGEKYCGAAKMFRGLGSGAHTITVKPKTPGNTVLDSFIVPIVSGFAPVLLGHIPDIANWAAFSSVLSNDPNSPNYGGIVCAAVNEIIDQVAFEWASDGFPVVSVPINEFLSKATDYDDGVHPTNIGHLNYARGYLSKVHIVP